MLDIPEFILQLPKYPYRRCDQIFHKNILHDIPVCFFHKNILHDIPVFFLEEK
jgi:hypothetical protein